MTESPARIRRKTVNDETLQGGIVLQGGLDHEFDPGKFTTQGGYHFRNVLFDMHPVIEKILHDHDPGAALRHKFPYLVGQGRLAQGKKGRQDRRAPDLARNPLHHGRELQGNLLAPAAVTKDDHSRFLHTPLPKKMKKGPRSWQAAFEPTLFPMLMLVILMNHRSLFVVGMIVIVIMGMTVSQIPVGMLMVMLDHGRGGLAPQTSATLAHNGPP